MMNLSDLVLPPWVKPALAAVALSGAFLGGWTVNGWRWSAHEAKALKQAEIARDRQITKAQSEGTLYEQAKATRDASQRTRETQVRTIYRAVTVPANCEPPADALGVLDNAIREANSGAP